MTKAFVLMTAMPPTIGHMNLIKFAASIGADEVRVILCTQPNEPMVAQRMSALREAIENYDRYFNSIGLFYLHRELEQDPSAPGFWDMWKDIMVQHGAVDGDIYVTSEPYGKTMAEVMNGKFMPFDISRDYHYTKATDVREDAWSYFDYILPEFRKHLRPKITIFGAESTGKTTLAKDLARDLPNAQWLFEYARPYLENVSAEVTREAMHDIWYGQRALQEMAEKDSEAPILIQDTDLFSTIGYWEQPHQIEKLGTVPAGLARDAYDGISDLYIITTSNIPFEPDPIRYGDGVRESPDAFWIDAAERYGLPYVVLTQKGRAGRLNAARKEVLRVANNIGERISYDRKGM